MKYGTNFGPSSNCAGAAPPAWCRNSWCYVDPVACVSRPWGFSTARFNGAALNETHREAYSYQTCGAVDKFAIAHDTTNRLQGGVGFRSSFPPLIYVSPLASASCVVFASRE